jgi:hypothetical protein
LSNSIASSPSDEDFTAVIQLPVGTHQLKFIVDDEWRCSEDLATAPDANGNLVNYVSVDPDMTLGDQEFADQEPPIEADGPLRKYLIL